MESIKYLTSKAELKELRTFYSDTRVIRKIKIIFHLVSRKIKYADRCRDYLPLFTLRKRNKLFSSISPDSQAKFIIKWLIERFHTDGISRVENILDTFRADIRDGTKSHQRWIPLSKRLWIYLVFSHDNSD